MNNKLIKFILIVLVILFGSLAALAYFNLWPFGQKTVILQSTPSLKKGEELKSGCLVLDEQFCDQEKLVYNSKGALVGLGFKLPKGTKIYSPFESTIAIVDKKIQIEGNTYPASSLFDTTHLFNTTYGAYWQGKETIFTTLGYHQVKNKDIFAKGDVFALVGDPIVDSKLGDYNLILTFRFLSLKTTTWYTDINLLKQFFPNTQK